LFPNSSHQSAALAAPFDYSFLEFILVIFFLFFISSLFSLLPSFLPFFLAQLITMDSCLFMSLLQNTHHLQPHYFFRCSLCDEKTAGKNSFHSAVRRRYSYHYPPTFFINCRTRNKLNYLLVVLVVNGEPIGAKPKPIFDELKPILMNLNPFCYPRPFLMNLNPISMNQYLKNR
jgi:hypothetical protein